MWARTQLAVYERDEWQCRMPSCTCPEGRDLDQAQVGQCAPWAPSVDHIVPRALGGTNDRSNLRAAHQRCNQQAAKGLRQQPATPKKPNTARRPSYSRRALSYPVASAFPGNQGSRWS
jgi:5-methylcytosine-specific restriction endonuclease McrA